MDSTDLAARAIQEAFFRALLPLPDEHEMPADRRDRLLAGTLRGIKAHFPDAATLAAAANAPLSPYSPCLPLARAARAFAGTRGRDYQQAPESCEALLDMGADPFAKSPPDPADRPDFPGRYIFGSDALSAFEIALAQQDPGLTLAIAPALTERLFSPQHWSAYSLFCSFPEPSRSRCEELFGSLAERGLLLDCVDAAAESGGGRRRL